MGQPTIHPLPLASRPFLSPRFGSPDARKSAGSFPLFLFMHQGVASPFSSFSQELLEMKYLLRIPYAS